MLKHRMMSFTTERRQITPISYAAMQELMYSAQLTFSAVYMRDGGILRRNGLCRMGRDPQGHAILAFAENPDDLALAPPRDTDEDICVEGLKDAQFLDRKGGFDNFHRIYGIYARKERTHKEWVIDQTRHFEETRRRDFFDYGMLCRLHDDLWVSKAICYRRVPHIGKSPDGRKEHVRGEDGQLLYDIICTAAPGKGWDLTEIFAPDLNRLSGRLMGFVSKKWRGVPDDMVSMIIRRDVSKRVRRIMRGMDAYDLGHVPHYKPQTLSDRFFLKFGKYIIRAIHASTFLSKNEMTRLLLPLLFFAPMKKLAIAGTAAGKVLGHFLEKFNISFTSDDPDNVISQFWPDHVKRRNIPDQYERLDPVKLASVRWLDAEEAQVRPDGAPLYNQLPMDWTAAYIWGIFNGPPGVEMSHFRVGNQSVLLAKQPNGMVLEYWPQSGTVFARRIKSLRIRHDGIDFDRIRPLPKDVQKLLQHNDVVMVHRNKKLERLTVKPMTGKEYTRMTRNLCRRKEQDVLAPRFNMQGITQLPQTRPSLRLRAVSKCPVTGVVNKWEAYEEQVPVKRPSIFSGFMKTITDNKTAGGALEEGMTEVGEGVLTGATKMLPRLIK